MNLPTRRVRGLCSLLPARGVRSLLVLMALTAAPACYRYVPAQMEVTPPGEGVRVLVTRDGVADLESIGQAGGGSPLVRGTLQGIEGGDLMLQVSVGQRTEGFISNQLNQTVRVPTSEIVSFERRELDGAATALTLGAGVGFVTAVVAFIVKPFGRREGTGTEPPPDDLRFGFGLFSIPIGE